MPYKKDPYFENCRVVRGCRDIDVPATIAASISPCLMALYACSSPNIVLLQAVSKTYAGALNLRW